MAEGNGDALVIVIEALCGLLHLQAACAFLSQTPSHRQDRVVFAVLARLALLHCVTTMA